MRSTRVKRLLRVIIFLIIFAVMFYNVHGVLGIRSTNGSVERINTFYEQPENSLDVVFVGASGLYRYWSTVNAWHDNGITSYLWSTPAQPATAAKYIMIDVLKTQSPKLFVIDARLFRGSLREISEGHIRHVTDNMPYSQNRIDAIDAMLDNSKLSESANRWEYYYFGFSLYHSRWEEGLSPRDFTEKQSKTQGTLVDRHTFRVTKLEALSEPTDATAPVEPGMKEILDDLCSFCKDNNIPVLFITTPFNVTLEHRMKLNDVERIVTESGLKYIDFNDYFDEIGLDYTTDFYNDGHTNYSGMYKFTKYFSGYLTDNYTLSDYRSDPEYAYWDDAYIEYRRTFVELREFYETQ